MIKDYKVVKIPFRSKEKAIHKFKGNHFYIIDSKGIPIDNFVIFEKTTMHIKLKNPKHNIENYRKALKVKNIKNSDSKFIELDGEIIQKPSDWAYKIGKWANDNYHIYDSIDFVDDEFLKKLNKHCCVELTTGLNAIGLVTGSNAAGGKSNPSATEIRYDGGKYNNLNYVVPFSIINNTRKVSEERIDYLNCEINKQSNYQFEYNDKTISLDLYLSIFDDKIINFQIYNIWIELLEQEDDNVELKKALDDLVIGKNRLSNKNVNAFTKEQSEMLNISILKTQLAAMKDENSKKELKKKWTQKTRSLLRVNLLKEVREWSYKSFVEDDYSDPSELEAAHIISVEKIVKDERFDFKEISDPKNGLLIPANIHKLFDYKKITFTSKGEPYNIDVDMQRFKLIKPLRKDAINSRINNIKKYNEELLGKIL